MTRRKRVEAPAVGTIEQEDLPHEMDKDTDEPFVPFLSHLTDGSTIQDLDPTCCIPLFLIRQRSDNAVMRLVAILNGSNVDSGVKIGLTGMVSGAPSSIIVPLVGDLYHLLQDYVDATIDDPAEASKFLAKQSDWYGIVDGCQVHAAILELRKRFPRRWGSVSWKVLCVLPGHELDEYRQLAVVQNERNKHLYHFESTLYEMLLSLRRIYNTLYANQLKKARLGSRGVNVHHRDVAQIYDGGNHERNKTVRQTVSIASRLSIGAIEAIGEVANMVCPDVILKSSTLNSHNLTNHASILSTYDCRLFKKFISPSTLRGAKAFMNAVKDKEEDAQVNTIHRVRHWCESNQYRSVRPGVVNDQFKLAKLALDEEANFLSLIGRDAWPDKMDVIRDNLLRTTSYDSQLLSNEGNTTDILPKVWESFKRSYPALALAIEKQGEKEKPPAPDDTESTDVPQPAPTPECDKADQEDEAKRKAAEEERKKEAEHRAAVRATGDHHMSLSGISTCAMPFDDFAREVWTTSSKRVDLVLSAVPTNLECTLLKELPGFCQRVLKTGSYVFLLLSETQFFEFHSTFNTHGFKVCDHAFHIHYNSSTIRRRRNADFPQRASDIALIAKTQGHHPSSFSPDFISSQDNNDNAQSVSSFASFIDVAPCDDKLKRPKGNTPLFPNERSVHLFKRIIRLLTPSDGSCLDPFGGPLTTGLACLNTGRTCFLMDSDSDLLKLATGRLRVYATPSATMASLEDFTDPTVFEKRDGTEADNGDVGDELRYPKRQRIGLKKDVTHEHTNVPGGTTNLRKSPSDTSSDKASAPPLSMSNGHCSDTTEPQPNEPYSPVCERSADPQEERIGADALLSMRNV